MQNIAVNYCRLVMISNLQQSSRFAAEKVSFFKMVVHHRAIGLLNSWENWRDRLRIPTAFVIQSTLRSKFISFVWTTERISRTLSLRTMKMFYSIIVQNFLHGANRNLMLRLSADL